MQAQFDIIEWQVLHCSDMQLYINFKLSAALESNIEDLRLGKSGFPIVNRLLFKLALNLLI